MALDLLLLVLGGGLLFYGGDWLVDGITGLAATLRLPPVLVACVVMGFGTSAPELFVAINAMLSSAPDIAMGNVVGSNIANLLLVLALSALVMPLTIDREVLQIDGGAMILSALCLGAFAIDGVVSRFDASLLLLSMLAYLTIRWWRLPEDIETEPETTGRLTPAVCRCAFALMALPVGAHLFIDGAVATAARLDVPEALIGLTVVAIGTSLPEMASCIAAALRKRSDVILGGILGSNVFNGSIVLGGAAMVLPVDIAEPFKNFWLPVMIVASVVSLVLLRTGFLLSRREAAFMLLSYAAIFAV